MANHLCDPSPGNNALGVYGAGGAGREIAWLAQECWGERLALTFVLDTNEATESACNGIPVETLGKFAARSKSTPVVVAIGGPRSREAMVQRCMEVGLRFATLVHPRAETSRWVTIGTGSMICAGVVLTTNIDIGRHTYINVGCTVSHDARLADFVTLSPGVHIAGWVTVGRGAFFGTGAVVRNGSKDRPLVIGDYAVIGAGACVTRDVEAGTTVVGVPAATLNR